MPTYGSLSGGGVERYGGGRPTQVEAVLNSLNAGRGSLYDTEYPSNVRLENLALAKAIAQVWSYANRMSNQWDPSRMTEFLSRWEVVLGIVPEFGATDNARREVVAAAFARVAQIGIYQTVYDQMVSVLGDIFVGIVHYDSSNAVVWTPSGWSVGSHDATGLVTWYSTIALITIQVHQPSGMTDGEYFTTLGKANPILETLLPGWVMWQFIRMNNGDGLFYLDTGWPGGVVPAGESEFNLDNEGLQ